MSKDSSFRRILSQHDSFIITTHQSCDGDGLGAGCALAWGLKKAGKKASFVILNPLPKKYEFLNKGNLIRFLDTSAVAKLKLKKTHCVLAVDVNDPPLIEPLYSSVLKQKARIAFIDHHPLLEKIPGHEYFINTKASSTGEIVHGLFKKLKIPLDERIAVGLYTSIVFDTKCFRSVKNSPVPFSICAELIPHISNVDDIYENLFKNFTVERLKFFSYLNKVEYFNKNQFALLRLTSADLKKHKASVGTACDLLDMIMNVSSMEIAVMILDRGSRQFKISIRSRRSNILPLARSLGGGGHKLSAGAYIQNSSYRSVKGKIISKFKSGLRSKNGLPL